jgi:hypothetical protein
LVVGIPTYGRTFTLESTSSTGIGAPASGPGNMGLITGQQGFLGKILRICNTIIYFLDLDFVNRNNMYCMCGGQEKLLAKIA